MKLLTRRRGFTLATLLLLAPGVAAELPWLAGAPKVVTPPAVLRPPRAGGHAVFRSLDQGLAWSFAGHGMDADNRVNALLALDRGALAGTDQGIFSSSDAEHWKPIRAGVPEQVRVHNLMTDGDRVFAATAKHGVLRSSDYGTTWTVARQGLSDDNILSLAHQGSRTFAGSDGQGIFVSENGGTSWRRLGEGLPAGSQVFDLQVVGEELFAGLYSKGVFKLPAGRDRWEKTGEIVPLQLAATPTTLFAGHNPGGIWTSRDRGKSWLETSLGLPGNAPIWVLASRGDTVFLGTVGGGGLYVSRNEGALWTRNATGLPEHSSPVSFAVGKDYVLTGVVLDSETALERRMDADGRRSPTGVNQAVPSPRR